jgi:hypothetical protein
MLAIDEPEMYNHVEQAGSDFEGALREELEHITLVSTRKLDTLLVACALVKGDLGHYTDAEYPSRSLRLLTEALQAFHRI